MFFPNITIMSLHLRCHETGREILLSIGVMVVTRPGDGIFVGGSKDRVDRLPDDMKRKDGCRVLCDYNGVDVYVGSADPMGDFLSVSSLKQENFLFSIDRGVLDLYFPNLSDAVFPPRPAWVIQQFI